MLVKKHELRSALINLDNRNTLIQKLDSVPASQKNAVFKIILAGWLGSNCSFEKIKYKELFKHHEFYIMAMYQCLITLDKAISLWSSQAKVQKMFQRCQLELLMFYNIHYQWLSCSPEKLFKTFAAIIRALNQEAYGNPELASTHNIYEKCLSLLADALSQKTHKSSPVWTGLKEFFLQSPSIGVATNKLITASLCPHTLYQALELYNNENYLINKLLIPADNNIILDGLQVKRKDQSSDTVVLALVGHFQSEHNYIACCVKNFQALFNTDTVFINHRNYSTRAAIHANSIHDLAQDVVTFVHYYRKRDKNIVLYGMCGGAAHMIMAAHLLMQQNISFKLIVDRFANQYVNFVDSKTQLRQLRYLKIDHARSTIRVYTDYLLILLLIFTLYLIAKLLLSLSKTNVNFGALIRTIPDDDLLILQAKSRKIPSQSDPLFTDLVVHPTNDIRQSIKDKRHQKKLILKSLGQLCSNIASSFKESSMQDIFKELAECFYSYIQLINDEKLIDSSSPSTPTDLHSIPLFSLKTRSQVGIGNFISGFFAKPSTEILKTLDKLKPYDCCRIEEVLTALNKREDNGLSSRLLSIFFESILENKKMLCNLASRSLNMQLRDLSKPMLKLMNSEFYRYLPSEVLSTNLKMS
ncbi:Uncharacterised protein [Legionella beliardensis]|uniref:Uncharacterized protein n=1 Tax=Legionella beliardensis TaxID=91822 RepID=A0A378HZ06_9GAMM|nr:hypothetical protein [Legionella beliardensis]STX27973.1 Uncharacterised protein [Legionella beliardensis]